MGQWGRGIPHFFPQKKSPMGVLHQHRSPLGRLNVKNEEIDEMIKEAPGPINFTVFLTMFGEKLKGERVPREPGVGSHSMSCPTWHSPCLSFPGHLQQARSCDVLVPTERGDRSCSTKGGTNGPCLAAAPLIYTS